MRKTIAAAAVAASLAVGGLAGSAVGGPSLAGAADTAAEAADGPGGWVAAALGGLVDDGTITQEQADAVGSALDEARPARGGHPGGGHHLATVAESLGMSEEELRTALQAGQTVADVAAEQGVDPAAVVAAIVAAEEEHLAERVAAGDLTEEEADARRADAEERATAVVEGERPAFGRGPGGPGAEAPAEGE